MTRSGTQGLLHQPNDNVYAVDLVTKTCSCTAFQVNGIPHDHAVTTIFARPSRGLTPYIPELLSISTWKKNYTLDFPLIDISDLQQLPFSIYHPPLTRVPRYWPKKERFKKDKVREPMESSSDSDDGEACRIETITSSHHITVQLVEREGTFLRPVGGCTIRKYR